MIIIEKDQTLNYIFTQNTPKITNVRVIKNSTGEDITGNIVSNSESVI